MLDKGQADASIVFTSDAQLAANPDKYVLLQDDKGIFPSGNVIWVTDQSTVQKAGPDYQATIEKVQQGLTLPVMQELNARVDIDKQEPAAVATRVPEGERLHPVGRGRRARATRLVPKSFSRGPGSPPGPLVILPRQSMAKSLRHAGGSGGPEGDHTPRGESQPTGS